MTSRVCKSCSQEKHLTEFAKNKQCRFGREHQCQVCRTRNISDRRRKNKLKAIEYLGGSCSSCGGVFPQAAYDFHHKDRQHKERDIGSMMACKWEKIQTELDKCVLLCANCHRIEHMEDL